MGPHEIIVPHWIGWIMDRFGIRAITLYPRVFYRQQFKGDELTYLRVHEQVHWVEQQERGLTKWLAAYLWEFIKHGSDNKYEIRAKKAALDACNNDHDGRCS